MSSAGWAPAGFDGTYEYRTATLFVFWPMAEHAKLVARWPQLTDQVEATWDEHRHRHERECALAERAGHEVNQLPGDVDALAAFFADRGITDPSADDLLSYPDVRAATLAMTRWPPARTATCWCGSGRKYKHCCRPHGLGSLDPA